MKPGVILKCRRNGKILPLPGRYHSDSGMIAGGQALLCREVT